MFIFLDTETTGTGPDGRLCQIAFKPEVGPATSELFNPEYQFASPTFLNFHYHSRISNCKFIAHF